MIVPQQGSMECGLATIAALADVSLDRVRAVAHEVQRATGREFRQRPNLRTIAEHFGGAALAELCGFDFPCYERPTSDGQAARRLGPRTRKLPLKGRGVVRVHVSRYRSGHIMPWADGLVYDPMDPSRPMTLAEWRKENPRWKVTYITVEK
jgi:hypothetical protein